MPPISEKALHYIWEHKLYQSITFVSDCERGTTVCGEVLVTGKPNTDAGPDFLGAKIIVEKLIFAGNVEIHRKASEWLQHNHHTDPAYDNTILHVVLEADTNIRHRETKKILLTGILNVNKDALLKAEQAINANAVPSAKKIYPHDGEANVAQRTSLNKNEEKHCKKESIGQSQLIQLFEQRLREKSNNIALLQAEMKGDEAEVLHALFLRHMGAKVNNEAFELLARSLPLRIVRKHTNNPEVLEALYLGQASLLTTPPEGYDPYFNRLKEDYFFLATKYNLTPIKQGCIRMLRLRPYAFPHRRLAIIAALRNKFPLLESLLLSEANPKQLTSILAVTPSNYWCHNYAFGVPSASPLGGLSAESINVLLLNMVLPYRYHIAQRRGKARAELNQIIALAQSLPSENNKYVRQLRAEGVKITNALESQAVLQQIKNSEQVPPENNIHT